MRPTAYVLLALALLAALLPLAVAKPGLPLTLKADEPAYYLAALSLARDHDLRVDLHDIQRLAEEYPFLPTKNLILATDDGWRTVYYGKPYIYPLLAAPFAALAGANGMVALNLLLLVGMVAMGTAYLRRFNPDWLALLFAAGFVFLSSSWAYGFWLHPEVFNMAAITASLYLALRPPPEAPPAQRWWQELATVLHPPLLRAAASGAVLALAAYNKPMLAGLGLAPVVSYLVRRRWRQAAAWIGGALVAMALLCGFSFAMTGHPSAYLGATRAGISVPNFDSLPFQPVPLDAPEVVKKQSSWHWIFRIPDVDVGELLEDVKYFLIGRHTGLFVYQPFTLLCLLLAFGARRWDVTRWSLLASLVLVALTFLLWIPFNWHGGGGFVGNRYFVNAVPGFLFLVTTIRPRWAPVAGCGLAALLLGPLLLTPLGAPVLQGTLQAHVRGGLFEWFPLELSIASQIPGYRGGHQSDLYFWGRKEEFRPRAGAMWIAGGRETEVWIQSLEPLESLVFDVENLAPDNRIVLAVPGDRRAVELPPRSDGPWQRTRVVLHPTEPTAVRQMPNRRLHYYRMRVRTSTGRVPARVPGGPPDGYFLGVALTYLGSVERVERDVFAAEWRRCPVPPRAVAGETLTVPLHLANRSEGDWIANGALRVEVGWRWLDAEGERVEGAVGRARFPGRVHSGETGVATAEIPVVESPGRYTLELEPLYTRIAWFSDRQADAVCRRPVQVMRAAPRRPSPAAAATPSGAS